MTLGMSDIDLHDAEQFGRPCVPLRHLCISEKQERKKARVGKERRRKAYTGKGLKS